MNNWTSAMLGDICEIYQPKTISKKELIQNGAYPVYGANGVIGRYDKFNHEESELLVTCRGATCGSVNISEPKSWITGNAMVVRPISDELDRRYLEYLFRGGIDLAGVITGAAQPQITRKSLAPIVVSYPPLPEQRRIVAILDEAFEGIDKAIANTEQNLANARELFENHVDQVFAQIGDGWSETTLGAVAEFRNGLNFTKNSNGARIKIVGVKDFQNNFFVPTDDLETILIDGELREADVLRDGDILAVRSNGNKELIGRSMMASEIAKNTSHSGFTIRIRVKSTEISPLFLTHLLKSTTCRRALVASGDGANINNLNQRGLSVLTIRYPSHAEQSRVVSTIEALSVESRRLESIYQRKLECLAELKQSILQNAFSGELTAHEAAA